MFDLDPELVLKNTWLWDAKTLAWAQAKVDQRAAWEKEDAKYIAEEARCLAEPMHGGVLPRCAQYPQCPCGVPQ